MDGTGRQMNEGIWDSAADWSKWEFVLMDAMTEATERMFDAASVGTGMHVLDLVCGAGSQVIRATQREVADGRVIAIDIASNMLNSDRTTVSVLITSDIARPSD